MEDHAYYFTVRRVLIFIFFINIAVAAIKGVYGLATGSLSMTADGLHSFFDSTSNIIGLAGIYMASSHRIRSIPMAMPSSRPLPHWE